MGARGATASRYFPKIKPAKTNLSLIDRSVNAVQVEHMCPEPAQRRAVTPFVKRRNLKVHVAVDVGGDLGGDMVAAQLAQRGLDNGGQRGFALGIDGVATEGSNLGDICGCGLDMHAAADQASAYLCQIKIVQVILAGAD